MANATGKRGVYKPEFAAQAAKLCRLGATNKDLADFFGVIEKSIDNWISKYPKFAATVQAAKDEADARVIKSLYQRAIGYSHPAVKIFNNDGQPMVVPYTEYYPPDTTACIYWTKNRMPKEWRDRQEVEHGVTKDLAETLSAARKRVNADRS